MQYDMLRMVMCRQTIKRVFGILVLSSLFCACGELDIVLPSAGTYQVKALVNNTSLDDRSLINTNDTIRPYFASSIANDPDITGLMVSLRDSRGETLGGKVLYTLKSEANENFEIVREVVKESGAAGEESAAELPVIRIAKTNIQIPAKRLDKNLPNFFMPENLQIGQYTLVFQILGEKETLYQTEKSVYYLGDAEFSLKDIQMYLPSISAGSQLVSPGATVMLEARVEFDSRLDPYIVWYNGKKLINEGKLSEGAGNFLWKTPDQTGFHSLRVEAFPFGARQGIAGDSRGISIPVSQKAVDLNLVSGGAPDLLRWYQFGGNLQDSKSAEWTLIPREEKAPRWSPAGYSYGLLTGPGDAYLLPPVSFLNKEGGGQFLFRFKPVSDGCIFKAQFASQGASLEDLEMDLSLSGGTLILKLSTSETSVEAASALTSLADGEYITAAIDFLILPNRFEAAINPAYSTEPERQTVVSNNPAARIVRTSIGFAVPLNGECSVEFGVGSEKAGQAAFAIWDEFALLHLAPQFFAKGPSTIPAGSSGDEREKGVSSL